jgi:hypothetical protein
MCKSADGQMCKCVNVQMCKCADVQICKCADVQMCKLKDFADGQMCDGANVCLNFILQKYLDGHLFNKKSCINYPGYFLFNRT